MADAVFVSLSTVNCFNLGEGGVVAPAVVPQPSDPVAGDLLITYAFAAVTATSNVTTLSGWTLGSGKNSSTGSDVHAYWWWKIDSGSEPSTYSWTVDNTSFGWTGQFTCIRIRDHDDVHDHSVQPSSAGTTKTSAATDTIAGGLLIYAGGVDGNAAGDGNYWTTPTGMTERQDVDGGGNVMVGVFTEATASTTANVTRSSTIDTSEDAVVYLISIAPAAGGTSATLTVTEATATAQAEAVTLDAASSLTVVAATATAQAEAVTLDAASAMTIAAASATAAAQAVNLAAAQAATFTIGAATATAQAEAVALRSAAQASLVVTAATATAAAEGATFDAAAALMATPATAAAQAEALTLDAAAVFAVTAAGATAQAEDVIFDAAAPPQLIYPVADISDGGWTPSTGTDLYAVLGEASRNDSDYVQSSQSPSSADEFRVQLAPADDPGVHTGHIVRYVPGKDLAGGDVLNLTTHLYQGGTLISTDPTPRTSPDAFTEYSWELTEEEAANITDYTDLQLAHSVIKA